MSQHSPSNPSFNISEFVQKSVQILPKLPNEQDLQACAYDVRRALINGLIEHLRQDDKLESAQTDEQKQLYEDTLRKALPPLQSPTLRRIPKASAWRGALLAVLGLLLGSALGQGLSMVPQLGFGSGLVVLSGILGVVFILWISEYFVRAAYLGQVNLPWGNYKWVKFRKYFAITWAILLALTILRDFFGARITLLHALESIGLFLSTGNIISLFSNMYGILAFIASVALLLKRPMYFDRDDFANALETAANNWWGGAEVAGMLLIENSALKNADMRKRWQQTGREIYSFASELPPAQKQWLLERLHKVGLEAPRKEGALTWHSDMQEHYIMLGHIENGDACFEDEAPILEDGVIVKKGTMRKIR